VAEQKSIITQEMKAEIGKPHPPRSIRAEASQIRRFAKSLEDPNRIYYDEAYARTTRYGGVIAPPIFLSALGSGLPVPTHIDPPPPMRDVFSQDGGVSINLSNEWELFEPIRPGDVIIHEAMLTDLREKAGRAGPMIILETRNTYTNQYGRVVATNIHTRTRQYRTPEALAEAIERSR